MSRTHSFVFLAFLGAAILLAFSFVVHRGGGHADAGSAGGNPNFALGVDIDGDGQNDCGTGVPRAVGDGAPDAVPVEVTNTNCAVTDASQPLRVNVYLMSTGGTSYAAEAGHIVFTGVSSLGRGHSVWQGCVFDVAANATGWENAGCAIGLPPAPKVQGTGLMNTFELSCTGSGTITLGNATGETLISSSDLMEHRDPGTDLVSVDCGDHPAPTPTFTPVVTSTPLPTSTPSSCGDRLCGPVDFALGVDTNGDGQNDCGTGVPSAVGDGAPDAVPVDLIKTTCSADLGSSLDVRVYLMDNGGVAYAGAGVYVTYVGVTSGGPGQSVWSGCVLKAAASATGVEDVGCAIGLYPSYPQTNLGVMAVFHFTCAASGTIRLGNEPGETTLTDNSLLEHRDAGVDQLAINCGAGGATPTAPALLAGDANCNGRVDSVDALMILQRVAGLVGNLRCPSVDDVNHDSRLDARDAALVLQYIVGYVIYLG
jgi:hypothetical protein